MIWCKVLRFQMPKRVLIRAQDVRQRVDWGWLHMAWRLSETWENLKMKWKWTNTGSPVQYHRRYLWRVVNKTLILLISSQTSPKNVRSSESPLRKVCPFSYPIWSFFSPFGYNIPSIMFTFVVLFFVFLFYCLANCILDSFSFLTTVMNWWNTCDQKSLRKQPYKLAEPKMHALSCSHIQNSWDV